MRIFCEAWRDIRHVKIHNCWSRMELCAIRILIRCPRQFLKVRFPITRADSWWSIYWDGGSAVTCKPSARDRIATGPGLRDHLGGVVSQYLIILELDVSPHEILDSVLNSSLTTATQTLMGHPLLTFNYKAALHILIDIEAVYLSPNMEIPSNMKNYILLYFQRYSRRLGAGE